MFLEGAYSIYFPVEHELPTTMPCIHVALGGLWGSHVGGEGKMACAHGQRMYAHANACSRFPFQRTRIASIQADGADKMISGSKL
jgi:hypothetical protein